jgi:hypothetical protein
MISLNNYRVSCPGVFRRRFVQFGPELTVCIAAILRFILVPGQGERRSSLLIESI